MASCILVETLSGLLVYLLQPLIPTLDSFQENSLPCSHEGDSAFIKVLLAIKKSKFSPGRSSSRRSRIRFGLSAF